MEQHGLVKRIRSEEDERVVLITITNLGKTIREEAYDLPNILLERSTLSSSEWDELNRLLDRLFEDTKN